LNRNRLTLALIAMVTALTLCALYTALLYAPTEHTMGHLQRIFYLHLPVAIAAFLGFAITFVTSIGYLLTGKRGWDVLAGSAAQVGELFATLVLLTGMLWARAAWNTWWTWDPRLTTTLVLWMIYAGYLILRQSIDDETRRARYSAVLGVLGFIDVPVVFMAIRWWRTIHPVILTTSGAALEPPMLVALLVGIAAFISLAVLLLLIRAHLEILEEEVKALRRRIP